MTLGDKLEPRGIGGPLASSQGARLQSVDMSVPSAAPGTSPAARTVTVVITACGVGRGLRETVRGIRREMEAMAAGATVPSEAARVSLWIVFNVQPSAIDGETLEELTALVGRVLFEPAPGKSHALNLAVAESEAELMVFTDDDALPGEGWLGRLIEPLIDDPELAGVGGPVEPELPATGAPDWYLALLAQKRTHFLGPKHSLEPGQLSYRLPTGNSISPVPLGANCAWRRRWLLRFPYRGELGPNRETGMRGGEDTCVALQVLAAGGRVRYVPDARVTHPVEVERIDRAYVVDGFRIQGRELVRVLGALGRPVVGRERFERHASWPGRLRVFGPAFRMCVGPARQWRRELRRAFAQGILEEMSD